MESVTPTRQRFSQPSLGTGPLTLRQNVSWTLAGNFVYAAAQWGMLTVLTKVGSVEQVGQFALALAVCAPVVMFTNLGLRAAVATDAKHDYVFGDYLGLRLVTAVLSLVVIGAIIVAFGYSGETAWCIFAMAWAKGFESMTDVMYGFLQNHERMDRIAKSQVIKGLASLLALSVAMLLTGSVLWGIVALAATWAVTLFTYDLTNVRRMSDKLAADCENDSQSARTETSARPRFRVSVLTGLAWLTLPLGLVMMLNSLNTNIPRFFLERYHGQAELGVYAAMAYLIVAGSMVVNAVGQAASPRLARYHAEGNARAFRRLLLQLASIGVILGLAGIAVSTGFGRNLLQVLYTPEYAQRAGVLTWIMIAGGIGYLSSMMGYGMTACRLFRVQFPLQLTVTLMTAVGCALLVPAGGMSGAARALVAGALVNLLGAAAINVYALRRLHKRCGGDEALAARVRR